VSASWSGCAGLVDDDPAEEDDDFEVDLEAVDVVSFALSVVSLGFNTLASDSILEATAPVIQVCVGVNEPFFVFRVFGGFLNKRGHMTCPTFHIEDCSKSNNPMQW